MHGRSVDQRAAHAMTDLPPPGGPARAPGRPLVMVCATRNSETDAILRYAADLADVLGSERVRGFYVQPQRGVWTDRAAQPVGFDARTASGAVVMLHYNPFSWGRSGVAPGVVRFAAGLRRSGIPLALMAHECYVEPVGGAKTRLVHHWQRGQFTALARLANVCFASTAAWVARLQGAGARAVHLTPLPISSSLPDRRDAGDEVRRTLRRGDEFVVAAYGLNHPSRRMDLILASVARIGAERPVLFLDLGAGRREVSPMPGVRTLSPGWLADDELARHLAAADLFLAPFADGVSLRRTTLMAAMQHGLALVGTTGVNTDPELRASWPGLGPLVAVGDDAGFVAAAVVAAARSEADRDAAGRRAAALYAARFGWSSAVAQLDLGLEALAAPRRESRR